MFVTSVPSEHADVVRKAIGDAGGGRLGNYTQCSFSYKGVGRFQANENANPAYGKKGELTDIEEERIEFLCERAKIKDIIAAMKKIHPYEEPAFHYFPVEAA
ncbi:hypothetical protein A3A38_04900 [Candidatus Kaiserbacteria bacterium RIFCSPLOWO2_01_FULL_53_17]|uniref:NGG1p interacting factor NIF3 n=1 Tax=Candidatus Kaiserbacteria bacterium RIFCSPLOWO2_01_FULL_53_17 TaxID=1798511 RepID=A0A1F6EHJ8_9BACT|nr:MAG: hypothetical protein A3A38_04900 [Candidatus Kaiserbacteria bacterium RIFCSPLOWO2_01_FULL_53_17]